jgi:hypothetical protein
LSEKREESIRQQEQKYWHLYSLQTLSGDKFIKIVNKILKKEYSLIK